MKDDRERAAGEPAAAPEGEAPVDEAPEAEALLDLVLAAHEARAAEAPPARIDGVVVGTLAALDPAGAPLVAFPASPSAEPVPARAMAAVGPEHVGRAVALLFEGGDPAKPVIMGLMAAPAAPAPAPAINADADGRRLVFEADKEIVLRCGDASITLTRAGKILIKGAYVLTRSSGVNRIQGGSVEIN